MSHELRTPLNAILGMTEGLKDEVFGEVNKKQLKSLQTIEASGFHLLSLINDILDVAKIESGKLQPDLTTVSLVDLCTSSLAFVKELAQRKNISIKATYTDAITSFNGDERLLRQVLIITLFTGGIPGLREHGIGVTKGQVNIRLSL
jgi:signal transduction histidine kinase